MLPNYFDIVVETFNMYLNKKQNKAILFYFTCILLFSEFITFILFFATVKYNNYINCSESKQCILELKMDFQHVKPFKMDLHANNPFIMFCTHIQKLPKFWADICLHHVE